MLGLFNSNKPFEPLDYESRKYFENNMLWLNQEFPEPSLDKRKIFVPTLEDFPIEWSNPQEATKQALKIVAENMQIAANDIDLYFYENGIKEFNMGSSVIFLKTDPDTPEAAGLYHKKNEDGKYEIGLDKSNLNQPVALVATIAHELSHIKLLGQKELEDNDEHLTDLATIFFGFGIFNANSSFQFYQDFDRWGHNSLGYLKQEEWSYALALFAFMRYEDNPEWSKYLNATIKKDFDKSLKYMIENESEIFQFDKQNG